MELQATQFCESVKEKAESGWGVGGERSGDGQKSVDRKLIVPQVAFFFWQQGSVERLLAEEKIDLSFRSLSGV